MTLSRWMAFRWLSLGSMVLLAGTAWSEPKPVARADEPALEKIWVYVGTYTDGKSKGIYRFEFDPATGKLASRELVAETKNPTFLAIAPNHRFLYAVSEIDDFKKKNTGAISAFAIEAKTGNLKLLNQEPTGGAGPCHVIVDKEGKNVLAANYGGGSVCVLPVDADGKVSEATAFKQHKGSGVNKSRQEGPHAHSINLDSNNHFAFAADLGLDKIFVYKFDAKKGTLTPNDPPFAAVTGGSGPRHFTFHPDGKHAYVINELKSTVTAFDYDADKGVLKEIQTVSTLPKDYKGDTTTAEVQVHPSGKFLYGSNRGHDSIAVFSIDLKTGELTSRGQQGKKIKTPRNFAIDPSGAYLLVANQDSDSIVVHRIDPKTGDLTPVGDPVEVGRPVCLKMMSK